ncbi:MAG: hypothetical protein J6Q53_06880 [Oscillospiraceae bacterium]|nr:hypothetical protein [Oscillospiraceae bacterium]
MSIRTRKKKDLIDALAMVNRKYIEMLDEAKLLEEKFKAAIGKMPNQDQDAAWDYLMHCESMSAYVLELACTYMEFAQGDISRDAGVTMKRMGRKWERLRDDVQDLLECLPQDRRSYILGYPGVYDLIEELELDKEFLPAKERRPAL